MEEQEYLTISAKFLENLTEKIEYADQEAVLEVEFHDGIIEINDSDARTFIINQHSATKKIWYSSPFSGADYFAFTRQNWLNKEGVDIIKKLSDELKENYGFAL
jgi:iron donor protein CyaY